MTADTDTTDVPTEQFARHVLPLCLESEVDWLVTDEVREQIDYTDLADPRAVTEIEVTDDEVCIHAEHEATVSEQVARRTHHHPAEYENHDVTVHVCAAMPWPEENYEMPTGEVYVEQLNHPTAPPEPDVDAHRYDL